jgi:hypothetical protein
MGELVAADHNGNQAGDLGDGSGKEGLQVCESGIEGRAALGGRNHRQRDHNKSEGSDKLVAAAARLVLWCR